VTRVDNSDSLRDGTYHSVWLDQNAARYHPLHEDTRHVAGCSASAANCGLPERARPKYDHLIHESKDKREPPFMELVPLSLVAGH
jgi:hypothetical protein